MSAFRSAGVGGVFSYNTDTGPFRLRAAIVQTRVSAGAAHRSSDTGPFGVRAVGRRVSVGGAHDSSDPEPFGVLPVGRRVRAGTARCSAGAVPVSPLALDRRVSAGAAHHSSETPNELRRGRSFGCIITSKETNKQQTTRVFLVIHKCRFSGVSGTLRRIKSE